MNDELISVIVPVYNTEKYLEKCLDSIVNQTYKNLDIIIINDGSTDNSIEICNKFKENDSRIRVISKENGGLSSVKNLGINLSKGDFISFVDSDDYLDLDMFEKLINNIKKTNSDICICNYYLTINGKDYPRHDKNFILDDKEKYNHIIDNYSVLTIINCSKLYKKNVLKGISFPEGRIHEDLYTSIEVLNNAHRISYYLEECLYHYVQRKNSIVHSKNRKDYSQIDAFIKVYNDLKRYNVNFDYHKLEYLIFMDLKKNNAYNPNNVKYLELENVFKTKLLEENKMTKYEKVKFKMINKIPKFYFLFTNIKNYLKKY